MVKTILIIIKHKKKTLSRWRSYFGAIQMTMQYWQNKKINGNELYIREPLGRMMRKINI